MLDIFILFTVVYTQVSSDAIWDYLLIFAAGNYRPANYKLCIVCTPPPHIRWKFSVSESYMIHNYVQYVYYESLCVGNIQMLVINLKINHFFLNDWRWLTHDGFCADAALLGKQVTIAIGTERFIFTGSKLLSSKVFSTLATSEALTMPRDVLVCDATFS